MTLPVGRIMDKAQAAPPEALFAAVQAAVGALTDLHYGNGTPAEGLGCIERALTIGHPVGSPEWLAYLAAELTKDGP